MHCRADRELFSNLTQALMRIPYASVFEIESASAHPTSYNYNLPHRTSSISTIFFPFPILTYPNPATPPTAGHISTTPKCLTSIDVYLTAKYAPGLAAIGTQRGKEERFRGCPAKPLNGDLRSKCQVRVTLKTTLTKTNGPVLII